MIDIDSQFMAARIYIIVITKKLSCKEVFLVSLEQINNNLTYLLKMNFRIKTHLVFHKLLNIVNSFLFF